MKLRKYNQFLDLSMVNENLDKSKKFMKDNFILNTAVNSIGLENLLGEKEADNIKYDMSNGNKKTLTPIDFISIDSEKKKMLTDQMRSIKIGEDKVKELISSEEFKSIREIKSKVNASDGSFKEYQLDVDNIGWLYNFVYFYYYENKNIEDLTYIYVSLIENKDMLNNLEIMVNNKLTPKKFDLNYINMKISNNAELLVDALNKIPNQRLYKKMASDLPSHLKRDLKGSPQIIKDQFLEIAIGFDLLSKDPKTNERYTKQEELDKAEKNYKGFWGQMMKDTRDGSPTYGEMVFQSPISRYKNIRDLIENARGYLKGLGNSQFESFYELYNECNMKFGRSGATQMFLENGIFIIEVKSYGANRILNSHTSHCIKDSLSYWNQYVNSDRSHKFVEENKQYYIYNFNLLPSDNLWTIGVTIEPVDNGRGYLRAAHDKIDRSLDPVRLLKEWSSEYGLEESATKRAKELGASDSDIEKYGGLYSVMRPLSGEEFERKKLQREANMKIIKKGLTIDEIKTLVKKDGADINREECVALLYAVEEDDLEKAKVILDLGGSPKMRTGNNSIINSSKSLDMIKLLVSRGSEITGQVYSNICDDVEAVKFLLDAGVDPNFDTSLPVRRACKGSHVSKKEPGESYLDTFKILIEYGAKLEDHRGRLMIFRWAAEYCRLDIIEEVVKLGAEHGFVAAYSWMSHCERIERDEMKDTAFKLIELAEKFETEQWDALPLKKKWHLKYY